MNKGFEPFKIPFSDDAASLAIEFCKTRGLTNRDVKIVKGKDGFVRVVVVRDDVKIKV